MQNGLQNISFKNLNEYPLIELEDNDIYVLYYSYDKKFSANIWNYYLNFLPQVLQNEVQRYRRWEDSHNCLIGKLLIYTGYSMFFGKDLDFNYLLRNSYGKPYIENCKIKFNISHCDNAVVCVFSKQDVGVDIENIKNIDYKAFENVFSVEEMQKIIEHGNSKFYEFWTIKEAISKAIGKGLGIPLLNIKIEDKFTVYGNVPWYTKSIFGIENLYSIASQASNSKVISTNVIF